MSSGTADRTEVGSYFIAVENFDDRLLELNGRAHRSPEIGRAYSYARSLGFPQINIDLIAGMLGESDANWHACVQKTIALAPDSVTIYQMKLPFNTTISKSLRTEGLLRVDTLLPRFFLPQHQGLRYT